MTHHGCGGVLPCVLRLGPVPPLTAFLSPLIAGHREGGSCLGRYMERNSTLVPWKPPPRTDRHHHQSFTNSLSLEPPPRYASHWERKCGGARLAGRQCIRPCPALLALIFKHFISKPNILIHQSLIVFKGSKMVNEATRGHYTTARDPEDSAERGSMGK